MPLVPQTKENIEKYCKDPDVINGSIRLWELLEPCLIVHNGRVDTKYGDKTPLGLYLTLKQFFK